MMDSVQTIDLAPTTKLASVLVMRDWNSDSGECKELCPIHQCLIFAVNCQGIHKKTYIDSSVPPAPLGGEKAELYFLFSHKIVTKHPEFCNLFKNESVHVITNDAHYNYLNKCAKKGSVEVVEMVFNEPSMLKGDWKPGNSVSIERYNKECIRSLLLNSSVHSFFTVQYSSFYSSDGRRILSAVDEENMEFVQSLLKQRADICYRHPRGGTVLHLAVERGHESFLRLLLKCGANIFAERNDGSCALHLAAQKGNLELVQLLLSSSLPVNAKMNGGSTPLHVAVANRRSNVVQYLLQHGADVNAKAITDSRLGGATPLHVAVEKKDIHIIQLLLNVGADVNIQAFFDITALHLAVEQMCPKIVQCLLNHRIDLSNPSNKKAFRYAAFRGEKEYADIFNLLLRYGFDVESSDVGDHNLLHGAIRKNSFDVVRRLLEYGAQVNELRGSGYFSATPLHTAAKFSTAEMVQLLLDFGADINVKCGRGKTPIYGAVQSSNLNVIKLLLTKRASIDDIPDLMSTAAEKGWTEIMELLLKNGVDPNFTNSSGKPLLLIAAKNGHLDVIDVLARYGASINARGKNGRTALHEASSEGCAKAAQVLLLNGAEVDVKGDDTTCNERTPLIDAAEAGHAEVIEVLLKFGARIDIKDKNGETAQQRASMRGHGTVLRTLMEYNFRAPNLVDFISESHRSFFRGAWARNIRGQMVESYRSNNSASARILNNHAIKMNLENLCSADGDIMPFCAKELRSLLDFRQRCKAELQHMKTEFIGNTAVSFYHVFSEDVSKIVCYLRNSVIVDTLTSEQVKLKFPNYSSIIKYQCQKAMLRKDLLEEGVSICSHLFDKYKTLPDDLKEKILNYLSNEELINLRIAFRTPSQNASSILASVRGTEYFY